MLLFFCIFVKTLHSNFYIVIAIEHVRRERISSGKYARATLRMHSLEERRTALCRCVSARRSKETTVHEAGRD